jgi:hypothetical protein
MSMADLGPLSAATASPVVVESPAAAHAAERGRDGSCVDNRRHRGEASLMSPHAGRFTMTKSMRGGSLRLLEGEGLIYRQHNPTIPPEVTYGLTQNGNELGDALDALEAVARCRDSRGATATRPNPSRRNSQRAGEP